MSWTPGFSVPTPDEAPSDGGGDVDTSNLVPIETDTVTIVDGVDDPDVVVFTREYVLDYDGYTETTVTTMYADGRIVLDTFDSDTPTNVDRHIIYASSYLHLESRSIVGGVDANLVGAIVLDATSFSMTVDDYGAGDAVGISGGSGAVHIQTSDNSGASSTTMTVGVNGTTSTDDIEVTDSTKGIVLTSPDNSRWRITVGNDGVLTTTEIV